MNTGLKESWIDFKKEMSWNNLKIFICMSIPMGLYLYGYTFWIKAVDPLMRANANPQTPEQVLLSLCVIIGFVGPIFLLFPAFQLGYAIGRSLKIFTDNKNRTVWWDDITYLVRDMPDEERQKIANLLFPYKSKLQLQKEKKANQSWFRRNFT